MAAVADLETKFNEAVERVKTEKRPDGSSATNEEKLKLYGLFKQIKDGDCNSSQPWAVQIEARAKWDAHNSNKGKSKEQCMQEYIDEVNRQLGSK